jgi:hypothetical protein
MKIFLSKKQLENKNLFFSVRSAIVYTKSSQKILSGGTIAGSKSIQVYD